ncbi:MAG: YggT family protein [Candidatus Aminicenantes bacterium]|nr:YggT family protein [Candidatus Aminicenantes bacterium]
MIAGNFLRVLANLIHGVINVYILIIIVRSVMSWMGRVPRHPLVRVLRQLTDPVFRYVHRVLPFTIVGGIDISPLMIVMALYFIDDFLYSVLLGFAVKLLAGG